MRDRVEKERPTLLVLASTYPRWIGDHEPGFVHELAKRLTDQFKVIALVPRAPGAARVETMDGVEVLRYRYAPRRYETLVNDGGIVTNLRRQRWKIVLVPTFMMGQAWSAWRLLRTRRVDVIHAHWLIPQGLIAALVGIFSKPRSPYIATAHGADLFALRGKIFNALKQQVIRRATMITVVSNVMREHLAQLGADANKITVQPMGVDLSGRFKPDPTVIRSRDEILFVGRLVEKKGLTHLINAMPEIIARHPDAYLTVVGFGPEERGCRAQAAQLRLQSKVHFLGSLSQEELPKLYRRAALFVAPFIEAASGDQEGLGLVMVEAAGCGCPVVASDLRAVRDVFDSSQAILVTPGSALAIGNAVSEVMNDAFLWESQALKTRSALHAKFDWSLVAASYANKINQIAEKHFGAG